MAKKILAVGIIVILSMWVRPVNADRLVTPQIVGGAIVTPNEFPWQALLYIGGYMCGGTLIHPQWVLTASHCVEGMTAGQATVYLGLHDRNSFTLATNPYLQVATVSQILMHASYNSYTTDYDVALLKLTAPVSLTTGVQIIPLAASGQAALYTADTPLTVSGWGTTSSGGNTSRYLRKVTVPVVSNAKCNTLYGGGITARMMCAGDTVNGGVDSCQGDSGGPLIGQQNGNWVQVGIVSWGVGCADAAYPGVYTNVANLRSWVAGRIPLSEPIVVSKTPVPTKPKPPTKTPRPTATATPRPDWMMSVANGSLEAGSDGAWLEVSTSYPSIIESDLRVKARSGAYYGWFGGAANEASQMTQSVLVPASAPYLRIYYKSNSAEDCVTMGDTILITVAGKSVYAGDLCKKNNTTNWKPLTFDLRGMVGTTVELSIQTQTDSDALISNFWIDDIGFVQSKNQVLNYYRGSTSRGVAVMPVAR
jgi:secreted trypsin-like serine protease